MPAPSAEGGEAPGWQVRPVFRDLSLSVTARVFGFDGSLIHRCDDYLGYVDCPQCVAVHMENRFRQILGTFESVAFARHGGIV